MMSRGKVHETVDAAITALGRTGIGIFRRGDAIVRPVVHRVKAETLSTRKQSEGNLARADGAVVISRIESDALVEVLTRHADFQKFDGRAKDWLPADCPPEVARMVLARRGHGWKLPTLRAIVQAPTLRPDGSVLSEAGYDQQSGLLLVTDRHWPMVATSPTKLDAESALATLRGPLASFPFVEPTDEAAALAMLVTAVIRPVLRTSPIFAVTAPSAGTGKSKLVDLAAILATGRPAAVITPSADEAELEKYPRNSNSSVAPTPLRRRMPNT